MWPDMGYKEASIAAEICQFIGDYGRSASALNLQASFAEILLDQDLTELDGDPLCQPEGLRRLAVECERRAEMIQQSECCPIPNFSLRRRGTPRTRTGNSL